MSEQIPTTEELTEFSLRAFNGIEAGLGQADPTAEIYRKLEDQYPGHLVFIQAGTFLHGYDRSAYALSILKKYQLKLVGTTGQPHLRVGFPAGNFKRRLWPMLAEFGIPYVVALGTQASGHTIYVSGQPSGNTEVLATVTEQIVQDVIRDLKQRGEVNKAAAQQMLSNPDNTGFMLKARAIWPARSSPRNSRSKPYCMMRPKPTSRTFHVRSSCCCPTTAPSSTASTLPFVTRLHCQSV